MEDLTQGKMEVGTHMRKSTQAYPSAEAPESPAALEQLHLCGGKLLPTLLRIRQRITLLDDQLFGAVPKVVGERTETSGILGLFRECLDEAEAIEVALAGLVSE